VIAIVAACYGAFIVRRGFNAKDEPSLPEVALARAFRQMSIPAGVKAERNPFTATPEILAESRAHFADHCATCRANNGSGKTEIGQNLYPKAPDMRLQQTQDLTDGEIYYIIHNGVRLTGMPAWGGAHMDDDSWKLVVFIRHLPQLSPQEVREMESLNPKTESERLEE